MQIKRDLREEQRFEIFAPIGYNINEKFEKITKKVRKHYFLSKVSFSTLV